MSALHSATNAAAYTSLRRLVRLRARARGFSLLPRQPLRSLLAGGHASKLRGRGLDFDEIRRYQPGDDPRTIDWRVTARTRQPHSRVFTEERERPVLLLVDQRTSMFFGSVRTMKSVVAAEAAALAAWRTIAAKDRVGGIVFNDTERVEIRPQRTTTNVMRLLGAVVRQNEALRADSPAPTNPAMLDATLARAVRLAKHDSLVVLITDASGASAETTRRLTEIARHNDVLVVFVFDPLEADLPDAGRLTVSDGQGQLEIDSADAKLRSSFAQEFADHRTTARRFLLSRDVPVLPLSTAHDTADQIARALGARPRK